MSEQITLLQALILGIVEGITEFLPISSTGHLLVCSPLIGAANTSGAYEIVIQLGAIVAVVLYYWKRLWQKAQEIPHNPQSRQFWLVLLAAFMPAAVFGLLFDDYIDALLGSKDIIAYVIASTLIVGGFILWFVDREPSGTANKAKSAAAEVPTPSTEVSEDAAEEVDSSVVAADHVAEETVLTLRQALWVGIAQCFAMVPGVSRSGATIVGGLLVGLTRAQATEFSFYLSIPTLGAATLYTLLRHYQDLLAVSSAMTLSIGLVAAFITAWLSIDWLLRYVATNNYRGFAIYRVVAGLAIFVWAYCSAA